MNGPTEVEPLRWCARGACVNPMLEESQKEAKAIRLQKLLMLLGILYLSFLGLGLFYIFNH